MRTNPPLIFRLGGNRSQKQQFKNWDILIVNALLLKRTEEFEYLSSLSFHRLPMPIHRYLIRQFKNHIYKHERFRCSLKTAVCIGRQKARIQGKGLYKLYFQAKVKIWKTFQTPAKATFIPYEFLLLCLKFSVTSRTVCLVRCIPIFH